MSRYQKGKTYLDFTEARDSEWQWHQLGHMQVCTSLQTDNHASTPPLSFLQAGCPSCCPTNSVKVLKAKEQKQGTETTGKLLHGNKKQLLSLQLLYNTHLLRWPSSVLLYLLRKTHGNCKTWELEWVFCVPDVLPATKPSVSKNWSEHKVLTLSVTWSYLFFIHHKIPNRIVILPLCWFPNASSSTLFFHSIKKGPLNGCV